MDTLKLVFFTIGTLAFFVSVYLSIRHPEFVESSGEAQQSTDDDPHRRWDQVATWIMWTGWGCAAVLTFLDRSGYLGLEEM